MSALGGPIEPSTTCLLGCQGSGSARVFRQCVGRFRLIKLLGFGNGHLLLVNVLTNSCEFLLEKRSKMLLFGILKLWIKLDSLLVVLVNIHSVCVVAGTPFSLKVRRQFVITTYIHA